MKTKGFSIIDAMLGTLVLSLGLVVYVKTTSGNVTSSIDNAERQMVAILASDLNNIFSAHIGQMGPTATRGQVISRFQSLSNQIQGELGRAASVRGYRCVNNTPVLISNPSTQPLSNSSLIRSWASGPYVCVNFALRGNIPTNFNGVWVETQISWVGLKNQNQAVENISVPSLLAPSP